MSLVAWYPLIDGSLENMGLDDTPLTVNGSVPFEKARVRTAPTFSVNKENRLSRPLFQETTNLSACAWIKVSATDSTLACFGNGRWDVGDGWGVSLRLGLFRYYFGNAGVFTKLIEANRWYHVAMTIDENKLLKCYLDGNLIKSATVTTLPDYSEASQFYLGISESNRVFFYPFNGQLQDFRYYDHCLSAKEVKELSQGLCLHLKCDGIGAGENMLKNSATMFNELGISPMPDPTGATVTKTLETDETAPCGANGKVLHVQVRKKDGADFNVFKSGSFWGSAYDRYQTPLTVGDVYCMTAYVKGTGASVILVPQAERQTMISSKNIKAFTDEWQRTYCIFRAVAPTSDPSATTVQPVLICYFQVPASTECDVYYCCPKIEKLTSSPYIPNPNDTQYSAYLPLQEDDCSGFGFNANYVNMTASDVEINNGNARYNTSLDFTKADSQYLLGEKSPFTTETKNFTISAWVKVNEWSGGNNSVIFMSRDEAAVGYGISLIETANDSIAVDCFGLRTYLACSMSLDTWYHFAVSVTQTSISVYLNGTLTQTRALTNAGEHTHLLDSYAINSVTEQKGAFSGSQISDFRIYTTALSATDIKALYETSASIDNEGNLHTYELDEGLTITSIQKTGIFHAPSIQETDGSAKIKQDEVDVNGLVEI